MNEEYNLASLIKMTVIIIIIIFIFYGLTVIITNNKKEKENQITGEVDIQYSEILMGSIYEQNEEEYYVIAELSGDYLTLNNIITNYNSKSDKLKIYIVDLDNGFNKKYVNENSNFNEKFPILNKSTLLKIKNKQLVEYTEGIEEIQKKLG